MANVKLGGGDVGGGMGIERAVQGRTPLHSCTLSGHIFANVMSSFLINKSSQKGLTADCF